MTGDKGVYIKNIYYMLSYAFKVLRQNNFERITGEDFDHAQDLFAEILARGVSFQLKQGLYKQYEEKHESREVLRGKLDLEETMKNRMRSMQKLGCSYDELTEDNLYNRILKTTMLILAKDSAVAKSRKEALRKVLVYFDGVSVLEPSSIPWKRLQYQRNNRNYEMLMNICWFVLDGMVLTTEKGEYKLHSFSDDHMARLYEKFILEYYRQEHGELDEARAAQVKWNLTGEQDESVLCFLPVMQTDIFLRKKDRILILDAKYYGKTMQQQFDRTTLHSQNLYQIFTYVKNQDIENTGKVEGLLLYAKTEEEICPDFVYTMGGNRIGAKTLDLNTDFKSIKKQLDQIVEQFLEDEITRS